MALPIIPAPEPYNPVPYKFYRIVKYKNPNNTVQGYFALNTFGIFETHESTTDLALASNGTVATAETSSGTYFVGNAIDGNDSTTWESTNKPFPTWFQVELPVAKPAQRFIVAHTQWVDEAPGEFSILGSNNGTDWTEIILVSGWSMAKKDLHLNTFLRGRSMCADGSKCERVDVYNWDTRAFVGEVVPDAGGYWEFSDPGADPDVNYMVVHHPRQGFKPQVDGPVKMYTKR